MYILENHLNKTMSGKENIFQDKIFWLTIISAGIILSMTLWFSLGTDQAIYAYSAWVWKNYHLPPYIGSWNHNFPGSHIFHFLALYIFGESVLSVRIFDFLIQLSNVAMLYYLASRISGQKPAGFLACIFYALYYFQLAFNKTDEKEGYALWLILLAIVFGLSLKRKFYLRAIILGFLSGFAFLVKPTFGLCLPLFGIWLLTQEFRQKPRMVWFGLIIFAIAGLMPSLMILLYYWRLDRLKDLYEATLWFNFAVYTRMIRLGFDEKVKSIILMVFRLVAERPLVITSAIIAILLPAGNWREFKEKSLFILILGLALVSILSGLVQGKNFPYYWIPFWAFLFILSGVGLARIGSMIKESAQTLKPRVFSTIFYISLLFISLTSVNLWNLKFALAYSFRDLRSAYLFQTEEDFLVEEYLKPLIHPGDEIAYLGWNPLIPFLLHKKLPSRFCAFETLLFRRWDNQLLPAQKKWMDEYTNDVMKARPRFFLISKLTATQSLEYKYHLSSLNLKDALSKEFPELQKFLEQNYKLVKTIRAIEIYELSNP